MSNPPPFFPLLVRLCKCKATEEVFTQLALAAPVGVGREEKELSSWLIKCLIDQLRVALASRRTIKGAKTVQLSQLQHVYLAIEILWEWRLRRFLEAVAHENCSHNFQLPNIDSINPLVLRCCDSFTEPSTEEAFEVAQSISDAIHSSAFNGIAMQRNMGRVLVSFIILAGTPSSSSSSSGNRAIISKLANQYLQAIICGQFHHRVVFGMQSTVRCSPSVRKRLSSLMHEFLLLTSGLEAMVQGYLPNGPDRTSEQVALVAKAITSVPAGQSREAYFIALAPQLVQLIRDATKVADEGVLDVCAAVLALMLTTSFTEAHSAVIKTLGQPLLQLLRPQDPLLSGRNNILLPDSAHSGSRASRILATHAEVDAAVAALAAIVRAGGVSLSHGGKDGFMSSLHRSGLGQTLIHLVLHWFEQQQVRHEERIQTKTNDNNDEVEPENLLFLVRSYFRALPQLAARQFELAAIIPTVNSFASAALLSSVSSPTVTSKTSNQSRWANIFEIRSGPQSQLDHSLAYSNEACEASLLRARTAVSVLLFLSQQPAAQVQGQHLDSIDSIGPMLSALFERTMCAFFGVCAAASGPSAGTGGRADADSEADSEARLDLSLGAQDVAEPENLEEAAAARDYVSSSGSGLLFPIILEMFPRRVLWARRSQLLRVVRIFIETFMDERDAAAIRTNEQDLKEKQIHEQPQVDNDNDNDNDGKTEILETSVALMGTALELLHELALNDAQAIRPPGANCASDLRSMLPVLERLAAWRSSDNKSVTELSQCAAELGLSILAANVSVHQPRAQTDKSWGSTNGVGSVPTEVLDLLGSDQPALKALGAKSLVHLLLAQAQGQPAGQEDGIMTHTEKEKPKKILIEVLDDTNRVTPIPSRPRHKEVKPQGPELSDALKLLIGLLHERESFVYLNALHGLCALAGPSRHRLATMNALLEVWEEQGAKVGDDPLCSVRRRALVGEGLYLIVRRLGGLWDADLLKRVASSCLRVLRALLTQHLTAAAAAAVPKADVAAAANSTETGWGEHPLFLQASALSLLAECVAAGGAASERLLPEALDAVSHVLLMPRPSLPATLIAELRRSAAFLIHRTLAGLGADVFFLNEGRSVGAAYKAIKVCLKSTDAVVSFHGANAYSVLSALMTEQLSPR